MKNQRKTSKKDTNKNIKVADIEPKKDAKGGRKHHHRHSQPTVDPTGAGQWEY